jgi:hypothetical protein
MSYTAYALVVSERPGEEADEVEIASYQSLDDAIRDMLVSWPADDSDVLIRTDNGGLAAELVHEDGDPAVCVVTRRKRPAERYRCVHETRDGQIHTKIEKL